MIIASQFSSCKIHDFNAADCDPVLFTCVSIGVALHKRKCQHVGEILEEIRTIYAQRRTWSLENFTAKVKNRWQRYRNPDMEENIEMVRLDHSYGEPPERRDQADIDEVAYEITVYDTSDDEAAVDLSWQDGRGIVELGVLSDQLAACKCFHPLNLQNCVGEKRYGLGSMLYVACSNPVCNHKNRLVLGKRTFNDNQKRGLPSWDVNRKAAGGELHSIPNFVAIEIFVITLFYQACHFTAVLWSILGLQMPWHLPVLGHQQTQCCLIPICAQ